MTNFEGRNRIFIVIFLFIVLLCALLVVLGRGLTYEHTVAVISVDGIEIKRIDLQAVQEPYSLDIAGHNTAWLEKGGIRMQAADCPDQLCVKQGSIHNGVYPIVCLPNRVIIRIESDKPPDFDTVSGKG